MIAKQIRHHPGLAHGDLRAARAVILHRHRAARGCLPLEVPAHVAGGHPANAGAHHLAIAVVAKLGYRRAVLLHRHHAQRSVVEQGIAFCDDHPRGHAAVGVVGKVARRRPGYLHHRV